MKTSHRRHGFRGSTVEASTTTRYGSAHITAGRHFDTDSPASANTSIVKAGGASD
jgi:hypothetical protein